MKLNAVENALMSIIKLLHYPFFKKNTAKMAKELKDNKSK